MVIRCTPRDLVFLCLWLELWLELCVSSQNSLVPSCFVIFDPFFEYRHHVMLWLMDRHAHIFWIMTFMHHSCGSIFVRHLVVMIFFSYESEMWACGYELTSFDLPPHRLSATTVIGSCIKQLAIIRMCLCHIRWIWLQEPRFPVNQYNDVILPVIR